MAQAGSDAQVVSQFPLPPRQYYASLNNSGSPLQAPPPPPGEDASYQMFGRVYTTTDKLPTLQESGRPILYSDEESPTSELLRLNNRLLSLFHILLATLSSAGAPHENVVARIEDVLINMQHLLNTLRPAQAARDLRALLDSQAATRLKTAAALREAAALAEAGIGDLAEVLSASAAGGNVESGDDNVEASVRAAVAVIQEHLERDRVRVETGGVGATKKREWYVGPEKTPETPDGLVKDTKDNDGSSAKRKNDVLFSTDILAEVERIKTDATL